MLTKASLKHSFLIGIVASLVVSALIGIFVLLTGGFDSTDGRVLLTTLAVGVFSITSLANLRNLDSTNPAYRSFSLLSIIISIGAFITIADMIWANGDIEAVWKWGTTLTVLAVSSAHVSLLLPLKQRGGTLELLVTLTLGFISLVAAMIIIIIFISDISGDFYYRLLGVFGILDVLGTIVTPVMAKLAPKDTAP